jgi:hypothetical protein
MADRNGQPLAPGDRVRFRTHPRGTVEGVIAVSARTSSMVGDEWLPALVVDVRGVNYLIPSERSVIKI